LLAIPCTMSCFISIPDSVEIVGSFGGWRCSSDQVLNFGMESRLRAIRIPADARDDPLLWCRSFLRVSTRSLKIFRMNLEFETTA
jgi:hypothetical protein